MQKEKYYRKLFIIGAFWNWTISLTTLAIYRPFFSFFNMKIPESPVWLFMFLGAVFVFGIGYFLVALDPVKNYGIVTLGIIGKVLVFAAFIYFARVGEVHYVIVALGGGDFIFAIFFLEFLLNFNPNAVRQ